MVAIVFLGTPRGTLLAVIGLDGPKQLSIILAT
jgi:hypothetical protein